LLDGYLPVLEVGYCEHSSKTAIAMLNLYKLVATGSRTCYNGADATIGVPIGAAMSIPCIQRQP